MKKKFDIDTFANSQYAIKQYRDFKDGNDSQHRARVLITSQGENQCSGNFNVHPKIEHNISSVDIYGDTQFERDYYGRYTNEYQKFTFTNGTLLIKGVDRLGNPIDIEITNE